VFWCIFAIWCIFASYRDRLSDILGFIECTAELYSGFKYIILGDFNFECCGSKRGFCAFSPLMNDLNLCVCDHMDSNNVGFTYSHNTLNQSSLIDHVFVSNDLISCVTDYKVVFDATNLSDHLPIQFCLAMQVRSTVIRCQNILSKNSGGIKAICMGIILILVRCCLSWIINLVVLVVTKLVVVCLVGLTWIFIIVR